ncbi:hypothetical protein H0H92_000639 [Tricholoma furcatifolium]|nr:hypothetical protein H0H92_000639 [Tricholoma furcatifolium]
MPWVLTHVCSRWRTVAFNLSALWNSRFHLDGDNSSLNSLVNLSKFPIHTGGLFIRISRDSKHSILPVYTSDFIPLWKQLANVGPIRDLEIVTQVSSTSSFLFDNTTLPDLRSLTLDFHKEDINFPRRTGNAANDMRPTAFKSMRSLQALSISLKVLGGEAMDVLHCKDIPWSQLTSFRFSSPPLFHVEVIQLLHCLAQCKSLVFLALELTDPKIVGTAPHNIPLPELTALEYRGIPTNRLISLGIPWFQLKEVKLSFELSGVFEQNSAYQILQRLRSVETLDLTISGRSDWLQSLPFPVGFPHLKALHLTTMRPHLLDSFICPSLTRLSIAAALSEDMVGVTFVAKYMPNIERIVGLPMMLNWQFIDDITHGLVFPRIREMSCIISYAQTYDFMRLLSARAAGRKGQLTKVDIYTDEHIHGTLKPRLDALNRELGTNFAVHGLIKRY